MASEPASSGAETTLNANIAVSPALAVVSPAGANVRLRTLSPGVLGSIVTVPDK